MLSQFARYMFFVCPAPAFFMIFTPAGGGPCIPLPLETLEAFHGGVARSSQYGLWRVLLRFNCGFCTGAQPQISPNLRHRKLKKTCPFWKQWLGINNFCCYFVGQTCYLNKQNRKNDANIYKETSERMGKKQYKATTVTPTAKNREVGTTTTTTTTQQRMKKRGTPSMHSELNFLQLPNLLW